MLHRNAKAALLSVMCMFGSGAILAACETSELTTPDLETPDLEPGTIAIDINPDGLQAPWTLEKPNGSSVMGTGDATLKNQEPGDYTITYGEVEGYGAPNATSGVLESGASLRFVDEYVARAAAVGTVDIDVQPDELGAGWSLITPDTTFVAGEGDSTLAELQVGEYYLWWGHEEGWASPVPNPVIAMLSLGDTLSFSGTYQLLEDPLGTVAVRPSPENIDAPWILRGPAEFSTSGTGVQTLNGRAIGEYSIEWGSVSGYRTPDVGGGTLSEGETLELSATYEQATGTLAIAVLPTGLDAPWTLVGNQQQGSFDGRGNRTLADIPAGSYTLTWGAVDGWLEPETNPVSLSLPDREQRTITGQYQEPPPTTGTIVVSVSPDRATWSLSGPNLSEVRTGDYSFEDVPPGDYKLSWLPLNGYATPEPAEVTKTLVGSETLTFSVDYALPGDPMISGVSAQSALHGSAIVITGSQFGERSLDLEWTGDRIENAPIGSSPSAWPGWMHGYDNQGGTGPDQVNEENAWSGTKSMDLTVDQNQGYTSSTLSYHVGPFERLYITYWVNFDIVSWNDGAKHLRITCLDCDGTSRFGTVRNTYSHTGRIEPNGRTSTWTGGPMPFNDCSNLTYPMFQETWKDAVGVGYQKSSDPFWWVRASRGASQHFPEFSYQENTWVRLSYYYDRGEWDTPSGEVYMSTLRPGEGLYIPKWLDRVYSKFDQDDSEGCAPGYVPELVSWFLYIGNQNTTGHIRWYVDDVYIQRGTRARVELGNAPVYADCTKLEIQPPQAWSDGEIQITLNYGGSFAAGEKAYLFVVNENEWDLGNRDAYGNGEYDFQGISPGREITLGAAQLQ